MARSINRLTARKVETITKHARHADGGGLYLLISPHGGRRWVFIFRWHGKRTEIGFGSARDVPLVRARKLALQARTTLAAGRNPKETRDLATGVTFGDCATHLIEAKRLSWRSSEHLRAWRGLAKHVALLWSMPVDKITTEDVLMALQPLWSVTRETAYRTRVRVERVLDAARARGLRQGENPARWTGHLDQLLPRRTKTDRHLPAMPYGDVPAFMARLRAEEDYIISARLLEFTILTATRTKEARGARWDEFDSDMSLWTVPADRMKANKEHRVPLSARVREILKAMREDWDSDFVFPGRAPGTPRGDAVLLKALRRISGNRILTVHGFRSSFRDWTAECTNFANDTCEAALAHKVANPVEAAYRRGDQLEKRRVLMEAWATYCTTTEEHKVLAFAR